MNILVTGGAGYIGKILLKNITQNLTRFTSLIIFTIVLMKDFK